MPNGYKRERTPQRIPNTFFFMGSGMLNSKRYKYDCRTTKIPNAEAIFSIAGAAILAMILTCHDTKKTENATKGNSSVEKTIR